MDIRTSQDVLAIGCCSCLPDACEEPRKECQSISVSACGVSLPAMSTVPAEHRCLLFKRVTHSTNDARVFSTYVFGPETQLSGTDSYGYSCATVYEYKTVDGNRECTTSNVAGASSSINFSETYISDDTLFQSINGSGSGSGTEDTWTSSVSTTYTTPPDGPETVLGELSYPGCEILTLSEEFSYSGYAFTYTDVDTETPGVVSTGTRSITYSEPVTLANLTDEITARIALLDGDDWPGSACSSEIQYSYGYEDPPEIPDPAPDPPEPVPELAVVCEQVSAVTKSRYRIGIPAGERWDATTAEWLAWDAAGEEDEERGDEPPKTTLDAAHAAWVIAHAAWTAADPDERGEEPLEPTKRTTYELQWDEVFFPAEWEAWKALQDAFDAATAAHEIWEDADPDDRGDEPIIPDDPGAEPSPAPSLVASRSWVYGGADEWSGWFEIAIPEGPGETRVVNLLVICYRSASLGQKPTAHGEVYEL
jgi:hypothetical protein